MNKHLAILTAGLFAIGLHGVTYAADSTSTPARKNNSQQNQTDPSMTPKSTPSQADPHATPSDRPAGAAKDTGNRPQDAKDDEAYQAKLKKCESMSNAGDKKACTDKAKKEHGQM